MKKIYRTQRLGPVGVFSLFLTLFFNGAVWSQVALPPDYPHTCHVTNLEAFVALVGGKQSLVVEAKYAFETKKDAYGRPLTPQSEEDLLDPPAKMAWLVPVPGDAEESSIETETLMGDLFDLTHPSTKSKYKLRTGRPQGITRFGGSIFSGGLIEEEGGMEWTWVEPTDSMEGLKGSLDEIGLALPEETLAEDYFAKGWKIGVGVLEEPGVSGILGPMGVEFPSPEMVFPLRFQSNAGEFTLSLYTLSDQILDHRAISTWDLRGINAWENLHREAWFRGYTAVPDIEFPESLGAIIGELAESTPVENLSFYAWEGKDYNGYGRTTERFQKDLSVPAK